MTARVSGYTVQSFTSTSTTFSQSVTIPAGTQVVVVALTFFQTGGALPTAFTWGGAAMTAATSDTTEDGEATAIYYLANPATGAQTLAVTWGSALEEGAHYFVDAVDGVDTTSPIRGAGSADSGTSPVVTPSFASDVDDLVVGVGGSFGSTDCNAASGANQTERADTAEFNSSQGAYGDKPGISGTTTFQVAGAFPGVSAVSLRNASGGGGTGFDVPRNMRALAAVNRGSTF